MIKKIAVDLWESDYELLNEKVNTFFTRIESASDIFRLSVSFSI